MKHDPNITWAILTLARLKRVEVKKALALHGNDLSFRKPFPVIDFGGGTLEVQRIVRDQEGNVFISGTREERAIRVNLFVMAAVEIDELLDAIPAGQGVSDVTEPVVEQALASFREAYIDRVTFLNEEARRRKESQQKH